MVVLAPASNRLYIHYATSAFRIPTVYVLQSVLSKATRSVNEFCYPGGQTRLMQPPTLTLYLGCGRLADKQFLRAVKLRFFATDWNAQTKITRHNELVINYSAIFFWYPMSDIPTFDLAPEPQALHTEINNIFAFSLLGAFCRKFASIHLHLFAILLIRNCNQFHLGRIDYLKSRYHSSAGHKPLKAQP